MENNIIRIEPSKCEGCNNCIRVCPVHTANSSIKENGKNIIYLDPKECIHCGACIKACMHNARYYVDDTEKLINDLKAGKKISIVAAPSIRTNFKGVYKKVISYLKSIGAQFMYDSSFGAEICTWGYLQYITKTGKMGMISQPCPAIVNFMEKHNADVLEQLMPVHSPMACTAVYMHKYDNIQGEIAFLSPCIAKYDEVHNEDTPDYFAYSVTFKGLKDYFDRNNISLADYEESEFDDLGYGLGSIFPMPGGLKENVKYHVPGANVTQSEGSHKVYKYLTAYKKRMQDATTMPILVDVLNCEYGCNIGTASTLDEENSVDEVSFIMTEETKNVAKQKSGFGGKDYKLFKLFDKTLKLKDFMRSYTDKRITQQVITEVEIKDQLKQMQKFTFAEQHFDCKACGYNSCCDMAKAIILGKNSKENCVMYSGKVLKDIKNRMEHQTDGLVEVISDQKECIASVFNQLLKYVGDIKEGIENSIDETQEISKIADQTRIVSFNAGVEAAKVGSNGNGFTVVADEVGKLANESKKIVDTTNKTNENLLSLLKDVVESTNRMKSEIEEKDKQIEIEIEKISKTNEEEK